MQTEVDGFFSHYFTSVLPSLTQEDVTSLANSLILTLSEPPKSYLEESNDFWNDILNEIPHDWIEQVKVELRSANKELLIQYITQVPPATLFTTYSLYLTCLFAHIVVVSSLKVESSNRYAFREREKHSATRWRHHYLFRYD